jgi:sulfate adenylyltransferase subunit 1 (EFTu-like GTPase family)
VPHSSVLDDTVGLLKEIVTIEEQEDKISALMEITLHLARQVDILQGT